MTEIADARADIPFVNDQFVEDIFTLLALGFVLVLIVFASA